MNLFRVAMTGYGLQLQMENALPIDAGFVKNEFVVAKSEDEANTRAIQQVRAKLQQQADAGGLVLKDVGIEIDEVTRSRKFWKLLQQEGFVFFPKNGTDAANPFLH